MSGDVFDGPAEEEFVDLKIEHAALRKALGTALGGLTLLYQRLQGIEVAEPWHLPAEQTVAFQRGALKEIHRALAKAFAEGENR